jgi:uncharacterized protein YegP (UPF0339 family)
MEFLIEPDDDGGYVWRALDELGVEIVVSRRLASRHACKRAILMFKVEASAAPIYDLSEARKVPGAAPAQVPAAASAPASVIPLERARRANLRLIGRGRESGAPAQRRSASSRQRP